MLILARTTPLEKVRKPTDGLSLFYTALDRRSVEVREIEKMGARRSTPITLFIDGLEVPAEDRIGEEGRGFEYILHGFNPERILVAAEAIGLGRAALRRAAAYAKERVVFGRPIGQNQAIQHPLAQCWMELEAAELMVLKAAWQYDNGHACGAGGQCREISRRRGRLQSLPDRDATHGGYGYAKEFHVERYFREIMIPKLAPVSPHLILCFHRREGSRAAEIILTLRSVSPSAVSESRVRAGPRKNLKNAPPAIMANPIIWFQVIALVQIDHREHAEHRTA